MTPAVSGDCLLETATQLRQDALKKNLALTSKNLDNNPWDVWAIIAQFTTDNAFYQRTANCLVILPAWITRPRFDSSLSESTYYTTSYVFAHEFFHGFDANGSLYDADGIKRDWWEPAAREAFQQKQQAMIDLFSQLEDYPGVNANGMQTLDENMADYGGIELALECYKQRLKEQGFTGAQFDEQIKKFFISFAAFWKWKGNCRSTNSSIITRKTPTHSLTSASMGRCVCRTTGIASSTCSPRTSSTSLPKTA